MGEEFAHMLALRKAIVAGHMEQESVDDPQEATEVEDDMDDLLFP